MVEKVSKEGRKMTLYYYADNGNQYDYEVSDDRVRDALINILSEHVYRGELAQQFRKYYAEPMLDFLNWEIYCFDKLTDYFQEQLTEYFRAEGMEYVRSCEESEKEDMKFYWGSGRR